MTESASGYERQDLEKYYTPAWVTQALLGVVEFHGVTFDPAAGGWHIVDAMRASDVYCDGGDIAPDPHPSGQVVGEPQDFFTWDGLSDFGFKYLNIVTNPPFGKGGRLAVAFIDRALSLTKEEGGKVAMLLRVDFDSASGRRRLFCDHPAFARKIVLTTRIRWANLPQSAAGPTQNHAWYVWDWSKDPNALPVVNYAGQKREAA